MMGNSKYSVVSLFSGAGGFDWGFHLTGNFQTVFACEILPEPAATLARNLGLKTVNSSSYVPTMQGEPVVFQGDVSQVDFSQVEFKPDVLIGGPPCQDFSVVRSKKGDERVGLNSGRGKLYVEFVRALMFLQPKVFVFENVPGFLSANSGEAIKVILEDLKHLEKKRREALENSGHYKVPDHEISGYEIIFREVVDAPNLGVPQTRKRLIIIGVKSDLLDLDLFEHTQFVNLMKSGLCGENSSFMRFPMTCIEVFEGKPLPELQHKYAEIMQEYQSLANFNGLPKAVEWRKKVWAKLRIDDIRHDYFLANEIEETPATIEAYNAAMIEHGRLLEELGWLNKPVMEQDFSDGSGQIIDVTKAVADRMRMIPPDENYDFVDGSKWKVVGKDISFIYRRAAPLKPAWTVMAYGGGGTYGYHYERNRSMLTLRERARIQTFTDDFIFEQNKVRAQIGEAVPPLLGQRIAERVVEILERIRTSSSLNLLPAENVIARI